MLKNAPMFKKIKNQTKAAKQAMIARGKVRGRGAQAAASRGKQFVASVNLQTENISNFIQLQCKQ